MFKLPISAIVVSVIIHSLWGGNVVAGIFALQSFPPFLSAGLRFLFGIATIWCWCSLTGIRLWPTPGEWLPILQIAVSFTLQIGLMNVGFNNTSGSSAAILISTNPLFAAVFAHYLIGGDRLTVLRSTGLLIAFTGVVLTLHFSNTATVHPQNPLLDSAAAGPAVRTFINFPIGNLGDWLCLASACLLGHRLIASASVMKRVDSYRLAFWQMVFSVPVFFVLAGIFETVDWAGFSYQAVIGVAYQGIVVAGIGFMVSLWLISRYQPSLMASFNFIAPVSGVLLSIALLGEPFNGYIALSVLLVAVGIIFLTINSRSLSAKTSDRDRSGSGRL